MTSNRRIRFKRFQMLHGRPYDRGPVATSAKPVAPLQGAVVLGRTGQDNRASSLEMRLSLGSLIDIGKLRVIVDKEFSLIEAAQAHELSEAGHVRGKIILNVT